MVVALFFGGIAGYFLADVVLTEKKSNRNLRCIDIKQKREIPKPPPIFIEEHNLRMKQRLEKTQHQKELETQMNKCKDSIDALRYAFEQANKKEEPLLEISLKDMNAVPLVKYKGNQINPKGIVGVKFDYATLDESRNTDQSYHLEYIPKVKEGKFPDVVSVAETRKDLLRM